MSSSGNNPQRRAFFRESLTRLVGPLGDLLEKRFGLEQAGGYLRPPGAIEERAFLETCERCGLCVEACPANAIFASVALGDDALSGTPVIDPNRAACVVCDGLDCMHVCPSGALKLVPQASAIRMGLAIVDKEACVRSQGEDCTICTDQCPMGESALRVSRVGPPIVVDGGCVGCGVCQNRCPVTPKAIVVRPR